MNIFPGGQHVRVANRIASWPRQDVLASQGFEQTSQFVIRHHLLQAKFQIIKQGFQFVLVNLGITSVVQHFQPGNFASHVKEIELSYESDATFRIDLCPN